MDDTGRFEITTELHVEDAHAEGRAYLLICDHGLESVFALRPDTEVVIGRSEDADIVLRRPWISRSHARIRVSGDEATVEDLRSHNGTRVNGERITEARPLAHGDVVSLGAVTLTYRRDGRQLEPRPILGLTALRQRVDEEAERAMRYQRPFCLLAIRRQGSAEAMARDLVGRVRLLDVVAVADPDEVLVLLCETRAHEVGEVARRLVPALGDGIQVGSASCPADGLDADVLLGTARERSRRVSREAVGAAELVPSMDVAGQSVVVVDPAMHRLWDLVRRLAQSDLPVLITGETGVGKELAAVALHHWSKRSGKKLVTLNCAALQETLVESELFGYEKGAFSGADAPKPGLLEAAQGGTVLLDEVGDLTASAQAKLLRVLETKRVTRLGGLTERAIDIRLVSATNRDLEDDVRTGRFREDLFFRLSAATVLVPPLRDRLSALPVLADKFLRDACAELGRAPLEVSPAALEALRRYGWPGNIRELKNLMGYLATVVTDQTVGPQHLPGRLTEQRAPRRPLPAQTIETPVVHPDAAAAPAAPRFRSLYEELRELERTRIAEALAATGGVQKRAAELLGIPMRTFTDKIKEHDLSTQTFRLRRPPREPDKA